MEQVRKTEALTKHEFHHRLRAWISTDEDRVGPEDAYGATGWVFVRDGQSFFKLNADTKRQAVESYLQTVEVHGDDLEWSVSENKLGNMTAVVYGPDKIRHTSFYLYASGDAA